MNFDFRLSDHIDWDALKAEFANRGRVEIEGLLAQGQAEALRSHLLAREDWTLVMNAGDKVYELPRAAYHALGEEQRRDLEQHIVNAGRHGFQYRYEAIRVPDGGGTSASDPIAHFVAFLSSAEVLRRLNGVVGDGTAAFADGQATSYGNGHFLTCQDDDVAGKARQAAYVFSLARPWRAEWGGLLMFHGPDGNVEEGFTPQMGALRLFSVPQPHSVSYVTPLAPEPRLSITGWLRAAE